MFEVDCVWYSGVRVRWELTAIDEFASYLLTSDDDGATWRLERWTRDDGRSFGADALSGEKRGELEEWAVASDEVRCEIARQQDGSLSLEAC